MTIKWRTNKNLNPEIVLRKIESSKTVTAGKVSFSGFEVFENEPVLVTMLNFGENISSQQKLWLVGRAIRSCANRELLPDIFLEEVNKLYRASQATPEKVFHLVTTISMAAPILIPKIRIDDCEISFHTFIPKKYKAHRLSLFKKHKVQHKLEELGWTRVVVKTKAKSPEIAAESCIDALNIFRSFACLELNSRLSISMGSGTAKPINKIILGKYHSLHLPDGKIATDTYWYEPHFVALSPFRTQADKREVVSQNIKWLIKRSEKLQFSKLLKKALIRYVTAFDDPDHHSTIIKTWGSLESLAANDSESNNDKISKRCSFLFTESHYHKQIIEHIREYRNRNVHYGETTESPATICYQLQFYFRRLVYFYLQTSTHFKDRDEANLFLDLPTNLEILNRRSLLIKRAIRFHSGPRK